MAVQSQDTVDSILGPAPTVNDILGEGPESYLVSNVSGSQPLLPRRRALLDPTGELSTTRGGPPAPLASASDTIGDIAEPLRPAMRGIATGGRVLAALPPDIDTALSQDQTGTKPFENVKAAWQGTTPPYLQRAQSPGIPPALQMAQKVTTGGIEMVPKMAGVMAASLGGPVASTAAAGALFGFDDEGTFHPDQAAVAAVLPLAGKWAGGIAGRIAQKAGMEAGTALNLVKAGTGYATANGILAAQAVPGWSKMNDAQKQDTVAGIMVNAFLGLADLHGVGETTTGKVDLSKATKIFTDAAEKAKAGKQPFDAKRLEELAQQSRAIPNPVIPRSDLEGGAKVSVENIMQKYGVGRDTAVAMRSKALDRFGLIKDVQQQGGQNAPETQQQPTGVQAKPPGTPLVGVPPEAGVGNRVLGEAPGGGEEVPPKEVNHDWNAISKMDGADFDKMVKEKYPRGVTQWAYDLATKIDASDLPEMKAAASRFGKENMKKIMGGEVQPSGMYRAQLFTEAVRMREAIDDAISKGATTDDQLAAISTDHGVGLGGKSTTPEERARELKEALAKAKPVEPPKPVDQPVNKVTPREIPKPKKLKAGTPYAIRKGAVEYHANQDLIDGGIKGPERDKLELRQKELVDQYKKSIDPSRIGGKGINRWYYHPSGQHDILDDINDMGGIATPSQSRFSKAGDYDGYEAFNIGMAKRLKEARPGLGLTPDKIIQGLQRLEGRTYGRITSTSDLYDAVEKAAKERQGVEGVAGREQKVQEIEQKQNDAFQDEAFNPPNKATPAVNPHEELATGSTFTLAGQKFKVLDYDPESEMYTVEDGQKFGRRFLEGNKDFFPDPGSVSKKPEADFTPAEEPTPKLGQGQNQGDLLDSTQKQDLTLTGEQGSDAERLAAQKAKADADAAEAKRIADEQQGNLFGDEGAGPGGTVPEDVGGKPQLAQLTDAMRTLAEQNKTKPEVREAYNLGKKWAAAKDAGSRALIGLRTAGSYLLKKLQGKPVVNTLDRILGQRHYENSYSISNARDYLNTQWKAVPKFDRREAISNYLDMGGDDAKLRQAEAETKPQYKKGYADARNLTPDEKIIAENIKNYFESRLKEGRSAGVLDAAVSDYIHRMYERDSDWRKGVLAELTSGISTRKPGLAMKRVFEYDYEAEKAGYKPIKDFARRVAEYDVSLNKAIADRKAVKAMLELKMPDGRPMVDVAGIGKEVTADDDEGSKSLIINPKAKVSGKAKGGPDAPINNRGDYAHKDYPALKKWRWVDTDANGKDTIIQGDVLIHPDAVGKLASLFERSKIRQNPVGRAALAVSSTFKQTAFDLSGFHPVQITVHGWEHRTFKPVEKIDFEDPNVRGLIKGGMTVGDADGWGLFSEGLTGSSLTRHIPVAGPKLQELQEALFNDYIPRLKTAMALHALERNRARFPNLNEPELHKLTANQANAAFGGLNWEMMGVSRTTRDVLRLALVAPDFLLARGKFVGQAGTVYGREQLSALMLGAATLYVTARILNKLMDDKYHFETKNAFNFVHGGKAYSLRTVQGDLMHSVFDTSNFIYHRLNPVFGRTLMEGITKRDEFGRKRTAAQQFGDFAKNIVPISVRGLLNSREQHLLESALNAFGITERRNTDIDNVYAMAENYKKANNIAEPAERIYDPDKDPYRGIKLAGLYGTPEKTAEEIHNALKSRSISAPQLFRHFEGYVSRPFTGSKAHEARFIAGLTADQKKIYVSAIDERKKLITNLQKGWQLYQSQK